MQFYDLLMIAVMAAAVAFGAWKGLAWQIASVAAIVVSYIAALRFRGPVAAMIGVEPPWDRFTAMFVIYLLCSLAIWIGFGFVRSFIDRFHLRDFDRQAGALLGAVKGAALCIVITLFAVTLLGNSRRQQICQSTSGLFITRTINHLRGIMPKEVHPILEPYLKKFDAAVEQSSGFNMAQNDNAADGEGGLPSGLPPLSHTPDDVREFLGQVITTTREIVGREIEGSIQEILPTGTLGSSSSDRSVINTSWPPDNR